MTETLLLEWSSLLLRGLHVISALAWIGASFYLISLENKFNRKNGLRDGVEGNFWTIQGGDFYYVEKYRTAPRPMPEPLHWFKYEAYFTWLTGFALLGLFYYSDPRIMLTGPQSALSGFQAVGVSIGSLILSWLAYTLYCRSRWARILPLSALVGLVFTGLLAVFYGHFFTGRAVPIHVGAALGTIMSANVFFTIIPWHRRLLSAIDNSEPLEPIYATHPGYRSRHNHYLTLPVLFLMLSVHTPVTFDGKYTWLIVMQLVAALGLFKHFHTCLQQHRPAGRFLLAGMLVFASVILVSAHDADPNPDCTEPFTNEDIARIIEQRCSTCHATTAGREMAGDDGALPFWDTPLQLRDAHAAAGATAMRLGTMPPGNVTGMTGIERRMLACWLVGDRG